MHLLRRAPVKAAKKRLRSPTLGGCVGQAYSCGSSSHLEIEALQLHNG